METSIWNYPGTWVWLGITAVMVVGFVLFALALHRTLRGELLGKPVRLTEIAPGMVDTEFSLVRFDGDRERADAVYSGLTPLTAADIAEVIGFVASRPPQRNTLPAGANAGPLSIGPARRGPLRELLPQGRCHQQNNRSDTC